MNTDEEYTMSNSLNYLSLKIDNLEQRAIEAKTDQEFDAIYTRISDLREQLHKVAMQEIENRAKQVKGV